MGGALNSNSLTKQKCHSHIRGSSPHLSTPLQITDCPSDPIALRTAYTDLDEHSCSAQYLRLLMRMLVLRCDDGATHKPRLKEVQN